MASKENVPVVDQCNKMKPLVLQRTVQTALGLNGLNNPCPKASISSILKGVTANNYNADEETSDMAESSRKELCKAMELSNSNMKPEEIKTRGFNP